MALSFVQQKLVSRLKKEYEDKHRFSFLINALDFDGVLELINIENFMSVLYGINLNTAVAVLDRFEEITKTGKLNEFYNFKYAFNCIINSNRRNINFVKKCLSQFPEHTSNYLLSVELGKTSFFENFTDEEIRIIFDNYKNPSQSLNINDRTINILFPRMGDQSLLNNIDKFYFADINECKRYVGTIKNYDFVRLAIEKIFSSLNVKEDEQLLNFLREDDRFQFIKDYALKHNVRDFMLTLPINDRLELLEHLLINGEKNKARYFYDNIIKDSLDNNDIFIYEILFRINEKYHSTHVLSIDSRTLDIASKMPVEDFLKLWQAITFQDLKNNLFRKKELFLREPVFSYMIKNEPDFLLNFKSSLQKRNSDLTDEHKALFACKEVVELIVSQNESYFESIDGFIDEVHDLFKDREFCSHLIKLYPNVFTTCMKVSPCEEYINLAFANGYVPDFSGYNVCKNNPKYLELWFDCFSKMDARNIDLSKSFNTLAGEVDDAVVENLLFDKVSESLGITRENFANRFNALKKYNREILGSLDYRLFSDRFDFLTANQIEMLGAHKTTSYSLCELSPKELKIVKKIMTFSSSINWVDLVDRVLGNIADYRELIDDLDGKDLTIDDIEILLRLLVQNNMFKIRTYAEMKNYDALMDKKVNELLHIKDARSIREAISLSLFGINYYEFEWIWDVFCSDIERFTKVSKNSNIIEILTLIDNVFKTDDVNELLHIYNAAPKLNLSPDFLVNLNSEIRREFASLYNQTLYKVDEVDKTDTKYYKEVLGDDGTVRFEQALNGEGTPVSLYSPIGLLEEQKEFSIMMTSLGAYSDHEEPEDYFDSWNVDLISSHGFCCSYLSNDNLGTARICHACLGFTDFAPDALLLSAPYDIVSSTANMEFNTSRFKKSKFCTPRGMIDMTRHTHNEVVWERRDLSGKDGFKKKPSYVIFFCEDFSKLSDEEQRIYASTVKAAMQLGEDGKPLPIVLIDRKKIAEYQVKRINEMLKEVISGEYQAGLVNEIITKFVNNSVGSTYATNIKDAYFSDDAQMAIIRAVLAKITDLLLKGNEKDAISMYNELSATVEREEKEVVKDNNNAAIIITEFKKYQANFDLLKVLSQMKKGTLSKDMMEVLVRLDDENYTRRYDKVVQDKSLNINSIFIDNTSDIKAVLSNESKRSLLFRKIDELEKDNIYVPNTPYDNRHIANMFMYATFMLKTKVLCKIDLEDVFDVIKFANCSYMDGKDKMNISSSIAKAEQIMAEKGYSREKIDLIKLILYFTDRRDIKKEDVERVVKENHLSPNLGIIYYREIQDVVNVVHDAACLDRARFITAGELNGAYFYDDNHQKLEKFVYQLQEAYAEWDIRSYLEQHPDKVYGVTEVLKENTPQEVIRGIRKNKIVLPDAKNTTYEDAFLEIDVEEKMDPLNLVGKKMASFGDLPEQMSIMDFYKKVKDMPLGDYLKNKITTRENLYLNISAIHGATHANNVSLFAAFIGTQLGLNEADIKTIIEASIYHDIGRVSDTNDYNHGEKGAIKYELNVKCPDGLNINEVKFLIEAHAVSKTEKLESLMDQYNIPLEQRKRLYIMATIIRDADALDRTRFRLTDTTNNLRPEFLVHQVSKEIIESALKMNYIIYQDYVAEKIKQDSIKLG